MQRLDNDEDVAKLRGLIAEISKYSENKKNVDLGWLVDSSVDG
jgi:hypothetical protein